MPVTWVNVTVPAYINETIWLPGPYDLRVPLTHEKEGGWYEMTLIRQLLMAYPSAQDMRNTVYMHIHNRGWWLLKIRKITQLSSSKVLDLMVISLIRSTPDQCQPPGKPRSSHWIHWGSCAAPELRSLINISHGNVTDYSPMGNARSCNTQRQLYWEAHKIFFRWDSITWQEAGPLQLLNYRNILNKFICGN